MICHTCARGVHTGCRGCPCRHKAEHPILFALTGPARKPSECLALINEDADVTEDESDE